MLQAELDSDDESESITLFRFFLILDDCQIFDAGLTS